jgi:chromate transporter
MQRNQVNVILRNKSEESEKSENLYWEMFVLFFKLGLFTIGGGMAMVPLLQEKVCDEKGWLTEEETVDCLAVSQGLPGVIAVNMSTYVGYKLKGLPGAIIATAGTIIPSFVIIILVVLFLDTIAENPYVLGAMAGIRAAATGLVAFAAYKLGKQVLNGKGAFEWIVALIAFVLVAFFDVNAVWVILGSIAVGIAYTLLMAKKASDAKGASK